MPAPEIPSTSVLEGTRHTGRTPYDTMAFLVDEIRTRAGHGTTRSGTGSLLEPSPS